MKWGDVLKFIVGIDPGNTIGIAFFDFNGNEILIDSKKNANVNWIIDKIIKYGSPIIVSTDVNPPPSYVKKLASMFSAKLFFPRKDLSIKSKKDITINLKLKNDHEMDAAASALFALKKYKELFKKIDFELKKRNLIWLSNEIKSGLVLGYFSNIDSSIKNLTSIPLKTFTKKNRIKYEKDFVNKLLKEIDYLKKEYVKMKIRNENLKIRNKQLIKIINEKSNQKCSNDEISNKLLKMEIENKQLRKVIEDMKTSFSLKNFYNVIELENYGKAQLLSHELKGKIVKIRKNIGNLNYLEKSGAKLIIADFPLDVSIPIIKSNDVNLINIENKIYVRKNDVEKFLKPKNNFSRWIKIYRERFHGKSKKR